MSVRHIVVEQFDPSKTYKGIRQFDCGHALINQFARKSLKQNVRKGMSQAYVLLDTSKGDLFVGYYSLMVFSIAKRNFDMPPTGATTQVPVVRLVMLGVDKNYAGEGLGSRLLKHCFEVTIRIAGEVGVAGVYLDAEDGKHDFYRRLGFVGIKEADLQTNILPMFISMETLKDAIT